MPHYNTLLNFINVRAQAAEHSVSGANKSITGEERRNPRTLPSHNAGIKLTDTGACIACKTATHPLSCAKFKSMSHESRMVVIRENDLCQNCLRPGHFVWQCRSLHECHECQRPHHSLLHQASKDSPTRGKGLENISATVHAAPMIKPNALLMTCQILVTANNGLCTKVCALLDAGSSTSFVSEQLAKSLNLCRHKQSITVTGVTGITPAGSTFDYLFSSINAQQPKQGV